MIIKENEVSGVDIAVGHGRNMVQATEASKEFQGEWIAAEHPDTVVVAAGILPAVEPGLLARRLGPDHVSQTSKLPRSPPGGWKPALYVRQDA